MARARRTDPETSHEAAESIGELQKRERQIAILQLLRSLKKATHRTLVRAYVREMREGTLPLQSTSGIRTRCSELRDAGLVRDSGEREVLPSNRRAIVWEVSEEGIRIELARQRAKERREKKLIPSAM